MILSIPGWARRVATDRLHHRGRFLGSGLVAAGLAIAVAGYSGPAASADDPVFTITFDDGVVAPQRLEVPAETRFEIQLINNGATPAEFESIPLRKEKVIGPGVTTFIVIKYLDPGEYAFFDDFHPDAAPAVLVAVEPED